MFLMRMLLSCLVPLALAGTAGAQTMTHAHDPGMNQHSTDARALPREPGQGAFAAIAEIVAMLGADPTTDWRRVDITALRNHLVDMDTLVTKSVVTSRDIPGGLEMTIAVSDRSDSAILRMVPAHARFLAAETSWLNEVTDNGDALVWKVTAPQAGAQIRALGFFGLMATGDHHREHHLAIATGKPPH